MCKCGYKHIVTPVYIQSLFKQRDALRLIIEINDDGIAKYNMKQYLREIEDKIEAHLKECEDQISKWRISSLT